jgi:IMP dehydrogenase
MKKYELVPINQKEIVQIDGFCDVFDIEVEKDHSYNVDGIIVHNSICSTRIVTGHGVPQLSAIMEVKEEIRNEAYIIADGGIKTSGDIVKALAAGADCVMIGSVLAGHEECPGEVSFGHKVYRGQSSRHFLNDLGKTDVAAEGEAVKIPFRGKVESTINELAGGIRSGFTYSGVGSISELQKNAEFIEITNHGWVESMPHAIHSGYEQVH